MPEYVLGHSLSAARRLEIQDAHFGPWSEILLDDLKLQPSDRIVELGCGAGSFSRRILRRLGEKGLLVGVDRTQGLLDQASQALANLGPARFEPVLADITNPGPWLDHADVVVARTMLHHVPMVEFTLGRFAAVVRPGTRFGFIEPDFRSPLARVAFLESRGRAELAPLKKWAVAINQLYNAHRLSPAVGATLARALELAGYREVKCAWSECRSDHLMIENMIMFYEEVRGQLADCQIMTTTEIDEEQKRLRELSPEQLPAIWGSFRITAQAPC